MAAKRSDVPYSKAVELGVAWRWNELQWRWQHTAVAASMTAVAAAERVKKKKKVPSVEVSKPKIGT